MPLKPGEESLASLVGTLQERFPDASEETIITTLRKTGGHAGQAAKALRRQGGHESSLTSLPSLAAAQAVDEAPARREERARVLRRGESGNRTKAAVAKAETRIHVAEARRPAEQAGQDGALDAPLLPKASCARQDAIVKAAWQLEDTQRGHFTEDYPLGLDAREAYFQTAVADARARLALQALVILSFFETPPWCRQPRDAGFFDYVSPEDQCYLDGVDQHDLFLSGLPYIPLGWGIVVEICMMCVVAWKLVCDHRLQVTHFRPLGVTYTNTGVVAFGAACVVAEAVDTVMFAAFRPGYRFAFVPRLGYMYMLPSVRRLSAMIVEVMDQFTSIATFLLGAIVFCSWIVVTIFDDDHEDFNGTPLNKGFENFSSCMKSMTIAGLTDGFPDIFLNTYTKYRATGLVWFFFLLFVQVLLLNVVLDTLVAAYMEYAGEQQAATISQKIKGIHAAFNTLSTAAGEAGRVSKPVFLEFVHEFSRSPTTRPIQERTVEIMFAAADRGASGQIDQRGFCDLCGVMQYDFWTAKKYSFLRDRFPSCWSSRCCSGWVYFLEAGWFDALMNGVLTLNFVLVILEGVYDLHKWSEPPLMEDLELYFSIAYIVECFIKLSVFSWQQYWSQRSNQFDFCTTWLLLGTALADELAEEGGSLGKQMRRYANVLRLLRLLRIVKQLKRFPAVIMMAETIQRLVAASRDILSLFGVVLMFFTLLSVQLWGGLLYASNPDVASSDWATSKHYVLNFNDVPTAFGVWFVHTLESYMPELPDVIQAADHTNKWSFVLFPIYYLFAVSIVFQLVMAFTIQVFIQLRQGQTKCHQQLHAIEELSKVLSDQGLALHYRVIGDVAMQEKIVEALDHMEQQDRKANENKELESRT
eukprot:TRINITY_DN81472_c0_g1_i1.p1 TRINITY_DN81472_c0_g1~~TRINITY_DN81472_c0_g1_i1.p1  ORF type:complete len:887 (+),score=171.25 TRINITY_DN81472_c0_g1_i1:53-2662(+)